MIGSKLRTLTLYLAAAFSILIIVSISSDAAHMKVKKGVPEAKIKLGAQLYDNWPVVTGALPEGTHALYPKKGKKTGKNTWRCKECHGWDYVGKEGRYSKGSHYTGIKGILDASGMDKAKLHSLLSDRSSGHDFSKQLSKEQLSALVEFIRLGLFDYRKAISDSGDVKGDIANGQAQYIKHCALCHGLDGNTIDFKKKKENIQGIGWIANDNPQETLHKIRWGHPGSSMPSAIADDGLNDTDAVDILKYSQSLE